MSAKFRTEDEVAARDKKLMDSMKETLAFLEFRAKERNRLNIAEKYLLSHQRKRLKSVAKKIK